MRKKGTAEALRDLEVSIRRSSGMVLNPEVRRMAEGMFDAGLVEDVEPEKAPPADRFVMHCGHCGQVLRGPVYSERDWYEEHRCMRTPGRRR